MEDDEDLVYMLDYNLNKRGYHPITALDGQVACRLIEAEKPDLILLDIMLPGINGWEICKIIRNNHQEDISEIPIIMLTALGSHEQKLKGIELGADDYISKPFSIRELLLKVDRLIQREIKKRHLNREVEKLEAMEARQTDFQNMLFHEVKNQLVIIGGFSDRIAENSFLTPEKYRQCGEVIRDSSLSLNSLAEEILMLSRLEAEDYPFPLENISLHKIMRQILSDLAKHAGKKRITIHFNGTEDIPRIKINPTAVRIALSNLVENAVKYSPEQADVYVRIGLEGRTVMVEVEDRGPGIPEADREKIFDKFYRGENVKTQTKGTGLGLHISKKLIESMGGTIQLENKPGNKTCFKVIFHVVPALPPDFPGKQTRKSSM